MSVRFDGVYDIILSGRYLGHTPLLTVRKHEDCKRPENVP